MTTTSTAWLLNIHERFRQILYYHNSLPVVSGCVVSGCMSSPAVEILDQSFVVIGGIISASVVASVSVENDVCKKFLKFAEM